MKKYGIKTYSELIAIPTFEERFNYLKINGRVGEETFGFDRYVNQAFYRSSEWKAIRDYVVVRDNGCDLAMEGYDIGGKILIHHMNPIDEKDIVQGSDYLLNPEYLICVSHITHNAIHYGDKDLLPKVPITRTKNDTCPWRRS